MNKWIAICAYSVDTPYERDAYNLKTLFIKHGVPYKMYPYLSFGDWAANCENNSNIIIRALGQHDCNIVYLDADATVHAYPALFDTFEHDIGLYKRMHTPKQKEQLGTDHHWDTGTMFFRNRPEVIEMLRAQQDAYKLFNVVEAKHHTDIGWVLDSFNRLINRLVAEQSGITVGELPVTYSYIFDTKQPEEVRYKDEVVIMHHQKSREHKEIVNG